MNLLNYFLSILALTSFFENIDGSSLYEDEEKTQNQRRRRSHADHEITDKRSRHQQNHARQTYLLEMLWQVQGGKNQKQLPINVPERAEEKKSDKKAKYNGEKSKKNRRRKNKKRKDKKKKTKQGDKRKDKKKKGSKKRKRKNRKHRRRKPRDLVKVEKFVDRMLQSDATDVQTTLDPLRSELDEETGKNPGRESEQKK